MGNLIRVCLKRPLIIVTAALTLVMTTYLLDSQDSVKKAVSQIFTPNYILDFEASSKKTAIHYVIIACKDETSIKHHLRENWSHQIRQIKVLFKSAALLTSTTILIVTNSQKTYDEITGITKSWPSEYRQRLIFGRRRNVYYPQGMSEMQDMFCRCCTERLFLPEILAEVDSAIFVDTDTLFMQPPEELWENFGSFDDRQVAGVTPCLYLYDELYKRRIPSFGFSGLNAGVLLLNMTRLRRFPGGWVRMIRRVVDRYNNSLEYADQDILNIIFSGRRTQLAFEVGCEWNYRLKVCSLDRNRCPNAAAKGVALLHGCATTFVNNEGPKIRAVFEAWEKHDLRSPPRELLSLMEEGLRKAGETGGGKGCTKLSNIDDILMKGLRRHLVVR
ncbi:glucoside xylosyltransferase 1-like [Palaemon carinicauda]|uniref:glucoside xylosyltransferase 1-like n=1 Tax=Palaemon carinicauda TaxID=392227 RepID=UPI0035B58945